MTVFGYSRVSTTRQADDGISIEVQEEQIKSYAKINKLNVDLWIRDKGVSGSIELQDRKHGKVLLEKIKAGDVVICSKLDRMFRSARDALNMLEELKVKGVALHFIDLGGSVSNGIGQLVFTILSAVAEQERNRIKERITEAKHRLRKEGRYQGGKVAFGYKKDRKGNLTKDEHQQKCIVSMKRKQEEGWSLRKISEYVKDEWQLKISHNAIKVILSGATKIG
jgi:DNA invertase Pin-like site-specific DNA recombinase